MSTRYPGIRRREEMEMYMSPNHETMTCLYFIKIMDNNDRYLLILVVDDNNYIVKSHLTKQFEMIDEWIDVWYDSKPPKERLASLHPYIRYMLENKWIWENERVQKAVWTDADNEAVSDAAFIDKFFA
jgi:hypothetical protein